MNVTALRFAIYRDGGNLNIAQSLAIGQIRDDATIFDTTLNTITSIDKAWRVVLPRA